MSSAIPTLTKPEMQEAISSGIEAAFLKLVETFNQEEFRQVLAEAIKSSISVSTPRRKKPLDRLVPIKELAQAMQISPKTLYQYVAQNRIPFVRWGKHLRFNEREVRAALAAEWSD